MIFRRNKIYMDYAAGAPVAPSVSRVITDALSIYGNPSSYTSAGTEARQKIDEARSEVASFLSCFKEEVIFTSSASESNSLALLGLDWKKGDILVLSQIEHPSILACANRLKERGVEVEYLSVNNEGIISLEDLRLKLSLNPRVVSIMYANNEIGSIQPVLEVGKMLSTIGDRKPIFHIDACQATGYSPMNVRRVNADLLSFNGSKIGGPRGAGVLFVKKGIRLSPLILGGEQEIGLRAGTENTPAILGLAQAIKNIKESDSDYVSSLRDYGISLLEEILPEVILNGPTGDKRLPNNISISLPNIDGDSLLAGMDKRGVIAGSGSACTSTSVDPSHVLKAIGVPEDYIRGSVRISFGPESTKNEIKKACEALRDSYKELSGFGRQF